MRLSIAGIVFLIFLVIGCSSPPITPTTTREPRSISPSPPTIRITITGIVDKATHQSVPDAILTFIRENPDGTKTSETPALDFPITTHIPADGQTRLWISINAIGYQDYRIVIRARHQNSKFIEFIVEMQKIHTNEI